MSEFMQHILKMSIISSGKQPIDLLLGHALTKGCLMNRGRACDYGFMKISFVRIPTKSWGKTVL